MSHTEVDHLVVAAATLEQGVAWCEATLGVTPGPGGRHALMSTHNRLVRITGPAYADAYLEIIAIDPDAPPPGRARWYGLDSPALQARVAEGPRLVHLVARSTMIDMHRWGLITIGLQPGEPLSVQRETPQGLLRWQILVREDGLPALDGALPTLIQWQGLHPATHMPDVGVTLQALTLHGVPGGARDVLRLRGVQVVAEPGPALSALLLTPKGELRLDSA